MKYLLDTNICVEIIRKRNRAVLEHLSQLHDGDAGVSIISLFELEYGTYRSQNPEKNKDALAKFCEIFEILPLDASTAAVYGEIRFALERKGTPIGPHDLLIAAHALSQNFVMVTNNTKEFQRVPNLIVENWCHG